MTEAEKRLEERMAYLEKRGEAYIPQLIHDIQTAYIQQEQEEQERQREEYRRKMVLRLLIGDYGNKK